MKKSSRKVCRFRKSAYLCNPVTKQGHHNEAASQVGESEKEWRKPLSMTEFIEKTGTKVQGSKYQTQKIESVNFLEIRSAGLNLRYNKYTKKSLILAQDER